VTRRISLVLLAAAMGCSELPEAEQGVVAIEVRLPGPDTVEVGETIQLSAKPLDANGDSVGAPVVWVSADPSATIDPSSGMLTGVSPGSARVQASVGGLSSALITFAVVAPADTLLIVGDSVVAAIRTDPSSPPLITQLQSFNPAGVLEGRGVIYAITSPDPAAAPPSVLLAGGVVTDTLVTAADGTASATLSVVAGGTPPDTVIVTVRAERTRGATVPGSGQRFIVVYQP
jgi:Bacterial Ig-like domain (group 2)